MAAENEPLLVVYQKGDAQPHMGDFDTSGLHESAQDTYRAAAEARRLRHRRKVRRCHHFLALTLIVIIGLYTRWFGLFHLFRRHSSSGSGDDFIGIGSTPLDGPLVLPDSPLCLAHGAPHAYPVSSYPLVFGSDHSLTIHQNATRRLAPPYDPPRDDDNDYRWRHVRVSGEVVVRQIEDGKKPSVNVEALSNDKRIRTTYAFDKDGQRLQVIVDDRIWVEKGEWRSGHDACLVVRVTVWVPEAAKEKSKELHLKNLHIGAVHLGVQLIGNLDLVVDETARLASIVGSIVASRALPDADAKTAATEKEVDCMKSIAFAPGYRFEAPETSVTTTSSPIRGPWSLLDSLHIFSVSGSVSVAVRAEGTADEHKELADLHIETVSGSIGFEELKKESAEGKTKKKEAVARPHRLSLVTRSGTAHGSGTFAQTARLHTTSGSIAVALAPHRLAENVGADNDYVPAQLDTDTVSGKTVVYLLNETSGNEAINFLESTHHAVSGSVELHYPASWVGDIHLKTVAGGSLVVDGKGVHVIPDDTPRWPPRIGRKVDAIKEETREEDRDKSEEHRSTLNADTVSGRVKLSFPE